MDIQNKLLRWIVIFFFLSFFYLFFWIVIFLESDGQIKFLVKKPEF